MMKWANTSPKQVYLILFYVNQDYIYFFTILQKICKKTFQTIFFMEFFNGSFSIRNKRDVKNDKK